VARGAHRKLSKEEKKFFKTDALQGVTVEEHDCDNSVKLSALLLTKRGTPVRINRLLKEADLVILLSSISFHYFAGFGGGRKLVLPGCADRAGIVANHRLSLRDTKPVKMHPACRPANLDGNPVHEDMCEALAALGNVYALNFFCDVTGRLVYLNAGDAAESHLLACEAYDDIHRVRSSRPTDVLILGCGGHPYDVNLLQAHKALHHGAAAVNPGGAILFFARCAEGVGSESLVRALLKPREDFLDSAYRDYDLNNQAGVSLLRLTGNHSVSMATELDDGTLENAGITRCTNAEAFVADALETHGADRISVVPHGSRILPFVKR
jgi:nickel-dependent lactate racemase